MSLEILLANFPQYSARKVRRLASQLVYLAGIKSKEAKDIGADLMDYNLMMARQELILNDDVRVETPAKPWERDRKLAWWGDTELPTTLEYANDQITEMRADWAKLARMVGFEEFTDPEVIFEKIEKAFTGTGAVREQIETVCVTPLAEAQRAIQAVWDGFGTVPGVLSQAKGIVAGSSFFTDRKRVTHEDGSVSVSPAR